jgi:hypothetical protein
MKKDIKLRLTGKKRKADKALAGGHGEGVESSGSLLPQSVTSGDREREGNEHWCGRQERWTQRHCGRIGTGQRPPPPLPNYSFVGLAARQMPSVHLSLSRAASALSWKTARYGSVSRMLSATLTCPAAHEGEQASDRIVGTQGQDTQRTALQACS